MASKLEEMVITSRSISGVALLGLSFGLGAVYASAQSPSSSSDKPKLPSCVETKGKTPCAKADDAVKGSSGDTAAPSPAQQFPFPAEDSKHGGDVQQEDVPSAPAPTNRGNGASSSSK